MKRKFIMLLIFVMIIQPFPIMSGEKVSADTGINYDQARAVFGGQDNKELFLGGKYIELGISLWGDFGTMGNKPANFRGTRNGEGSTDGSDQIGMSADHDGYGSGRDLPIDYYLPGTPEERFAVGYKSGSATYAKSNSAQMSSFDMPTTVENLSNSATGLLKAKVVSTWSSTMEVTQIISFNVNDKFYRNEVTLKNISSSQWDGARYMRSFDPDNTVFRGGEYETANTVTHTVAQDGKAVVKAETYGDSDPLYKAFTSRAPIFFYSNDPAAVASVFGFINNNPYMPAAYETPTAKGTTITDDIAITMTWDSGILKSGESKSFVYYTSLDERDFDDVQKEIVVADIEEDIKNIEDMDDVKNTKDKIDNEDILDEEKKAELKSNIIDVLLSDPPVKDIILEDAEDIILVNDIIRESDKSDEDKDDLRVKLVEKSIEDIEDLNDEVKDAIQQIIDDIQDEDKKNNAQSKLNNAGLSEEEVKKAELEQQVNNSADMDDAKDTKQAIDDSGLPEEIKQELYSKLTDKVLEDDNIDVTTATDVSLVKDLIENSDKSDEDKDQARTQLVDKAIEDIVEPSEAVTDALQEVIDSIKDEELQNEAQSKLDEWVLQAEQDKKAAQLEQQINNAADINNVKDTKTAIDESGLPENIKQELYNKLADKALEENSTDVSTARDVSLVNDLIENSNKSKDDKDQARTKLVDKAITDILEPGETIVAALQDVINSIQDEQLKNDTQNKLNEWVLQAEQAKKKAQLEQQVDAAANISDVKTTKQAIDTSNLPEEVKQELYNKLAGKVLPDDSSINIGSGQDISTISDLIDNANKSAEDKDQARAKLVDKAISEILEPGEAVTTALQNVIDSIQDEQLRGDAQNKLDEWVNEWIKKTEQEKKKAALEQQIKNIADMNDVNTTKQAINESELPAEIKQELHNKLTETLLEDNSNVNLGSGDDLSAANDLIDNTDKSDEGKDQARAALVDKAIADIPDPNQVVTDTVQNIINDIQDENLREAAQNKLGEWLKQAEQNKNKAQLEQQIDASANMDDVKSAQQAIDDSTLPEAIKQELRSKLTDKTLTKNNGINIRTPEELNILTETISKSNKDQNARDEALETLVLKALDELAQDMWLSGEEIAALQKAVEEVANVETQKDLSAVLSARINRQNSNNNPSTVPDQSEIAVIINGQKQNAGTQLIRQQDGKTIVELKVNPDTIMKKMDELLKSNNGTGNNNTVEILVAATKADEAQAILTGDIVQAMAANNVSLTINTGNVQYIIPAQQIGIEAVAAKLGVNPSSLRKVEIIVRIAEAPESLSAKIGKDAKAKGYELLLAPMEFEIVARTTSETGQVNEVIIDQFNEYVARVVQLPSGINSEQITTGVVYNADGTFSHIPTVLFQKGSNWYAQLNSLTNSLYSVIWNPVKVASVAGHWSETAVNDMASRLIVKEPEQFKPDAAITRADFAEYITKALGIYRTGVATESAYSDVAIDDARADAIQIATAYGIIQGYPDATFRPDAAISRQEAMVMYARAMTIVGLIAADSGRMATYSDQDQVAGWAYESVKQTIEAGVFNGRTTSTINPTGTFTYAEAATAVRNLLLRAELINE